MSQLHGVWRGGSTDCFLWAVFVNEEHAQKYLNEYDSGLYKSSSERDFLRPVSDEELLNMRNQN